MHANVNGDLSGGGAGSTLKFTNYNCASALLPFTMVPP